MQSNGRLVQLAHVQSLQHSSAELGISSAGQELIQFDQELVVRILRLDLLHGALVADAAAAGFQIDTHVCLLKVLKLS